MSSDDTVTLTREQAENLLRTWAQSGHPRDAVVEAIRAQLNPKRVEPTPGPWRVQRNSGDPRDIDIVWSDKSFILCSIYDGWKDAEANARLIAAAPDFLAWAHAHLARCEKGDFCDWGLREIVASVYGERRTYRPIPLNPYRDGGGGGDDGGGGG